MYTMEYVVFFLQMNQTVLI